MRDLQFCSRAADRHIIYKDLALLDRPLKYREALHETTDPAVLVAEFDLHGEVAGAAFVSSYVVVMTIRDGLIVHSRDYTDTAAAAERLKALSPAGSSAG